MVDFATSLYKQRLIPLELETRLPMNLPPGIDTSRFEANQLRAFLSGHGLSRRIWSALIARQVTIDWFLSAPDEELLKVRNLGKKGVADIRKVFPRPLPPVNENG